MQPVSRQTLERFAKEFAYGNNGFALSAITPYFETYEPGMPPPEFDGAPPRKADHFVNNLSAMHPRNQRYALIDLCSNPPNMKKCPDEQTRLTLLRALLQSDGTTPLAEDLSKISISGVREQWWVATSRLPTTPASAVTAARCLLESTCKTILTECGEKPDESGDLQRLFKQTCTALELKTGADVPRSVNEMLSGLISVTNGLAAISNNAGDRHGNISGARLENMTIASLCVHCAGVIGLVLAQVYIERNYMKP